jgi:hypothetical protein
MFEGRVSAKIRFDRESLSPSRQRRSIVVLAPSSFVGNLQLIAQHVPNGSRFNTLFKRFDHRFVAEPYKYLVTRDRTPIHSSQHLIEQLPEFTFPHTATLSEQYEKAHHLKRWAH